ncbi:MAG: ATP-binding cassette domain-containing protein [Candidatus Thiodiazotropha sp. (ex Lucinoma borealis)]|nr:ATP-binding cassette domain-containing protein [Candidatus Thiodiazotropha sp. (ex Lucinoma borealis)]MCU7865356.1 ATP-binding cassette domain-containing protein [Candidatus Thiodiazotropha sp. (ex Lucinoma borealis)]
MGYSISCLIDSFFYPRKQINVINRISFEVEPGDLLGIVGTNGTGKSTLLRCLVGIYPFLRRASLFGQITYDGHKLDGALYPQIRRFIGYVVQDPDNAILNTTVREEILFDLVINSVPQKEAEERLTLVSEQFGISHLLSRRIITLSQGEKQKVILSAVLARDARVLVLDEPTAMLDLSSSQILVNILKDLSENGLTVILAAHDKKFLAQITNKILSIDKCRSSETDHLSRDGIVSTFELLGLSSHLKNPVNLTAGNICYQREHGFRIGPINLSLNSGSVLWLRGPNGIGKSTIMQILSGLIKPKTGTILLDDLEVTRPTDDIGLVIQNPEFSLIAMTIEEELKLILKGRKDLESRFNFISSLWKEFFDDQISLKRDPRTLSYGQKKILSILSIGPWGKVIFLDEPSVGLDEKRLSLLIEYILMLKIIGRIVVFSSHDEEFANLISTDEYDLNSQTL